MGALIHPGHMDKVLVYIERGKDEGTNLLLGGERLSGPRYDDGAFVAPTVFDNVSPEMRIFRDEVFGPLLSISRFSTLDEAAVLANDTEYGLANSVWTKNLDTAMKTSRELRSGTVWVNCTIDGAPQLPVGGYKASGFGREMGQTGVEEFSEIKTVLYHLGKRERVFGPAPQVH